MFRGREYNKYNNTWTEYNGVKYQSKKEANYAAELDLLKKAGEVKEWKRQKRFEITKRGKHICYYYIDFEVLTKKGIEYIDIKGFKTNIYKLKKKLVEAQYGIKIIEK